MKCYISAAVLLNKMPELKTNSELTWIEKGAGENLSGLCYLLKRNFIPTRELSMGGDKKRRNKEKKDNKRNVG